MQGGGSIVAAHLRITTPIGRMRIALNGRFLSQRVTGVQRHSRELVRALDSSLESSGSGSAFEVSLLVPPDARPDLVLRRMEIRRVGRLRGPLWEQLELPFYARGRLLLNLGNTAPVLASEQLLMIHDASVFAVPDAYAPGFVAGTELSRDLAPETREAYRTRVGRTHAEGADTAVWLASSPKIAGMSGRYFMDRQELPCELADPTDEEQLWAECVRLTGSM